MTGTQSGPLNGASHEGENSAKVPAANGTFWALTALSVAAAVMTEPSLPWAVHLGLSLVGAAALCALVVVQSHLHRYHPAVYWTMFVLASMVGALVARGIGPGLAVALGGGLLLLGLAGLWFVGFSSRTREGRTAAWDGAYWMAVFAALVFGAGLRQLLSITLRLGSLSSSIVFAAVVLLAVIAYFFFRVPWTIARWWAYVAVIPLAGAVTEFIAIVFGGSTSAKVTIGVVALIGVVVLVVAGHVRSRQGSVNGT